MEDQKASSSKSKKKTSATQKSLGVQGHNMKASKRSLQDGASPLSQHPERSNTDSLHDSTSEDRYRALRQKYLCLEEECFRLGQELKKTEDEVMALVEERLTLLDQLVVMEGLVNPSDTP